MSTRKAKRKPKLDIIDPVALAQEPHRPQTYTIDEYQLTRLRHCAIELIARLSDEHDDRDGWGAGICRVLAEIETEARR